MGFPAFSKHEPRMQLRINVIQFWASIVPIMSMIKWQCHSCYCFHYCYYHHFLLSILLLFSWCAVLRNMPGLRDSVVMRVLSDFYWTAATGAGLFTSNSATQCSASCWALHAGGTRTLLRTSFVDRNTGRQSIRSGKYPRCSDLSLRGKNMHSIKARFVQLICKLSPGVVTL